MSWVVVLYGLSVFFVAGWTFVWFMHIVAILNAKLKLHKKIPSYGPFRKSQEDRDCPVLIHSPPHSWTPSTPTSCPPTPPPSPPPYSSTHKKDDYYFQEEKRHSLDKYDQCPGSVMISTSTHVSSTSFTLTPSSSESSLHRHVHDSGCVSTMSDIKSTIIPVPEEGNNVSPYGFSRVPVETPSPLMCPKKSTSSSWSPSSPSFGPDVLPGVSILKPLVGVDPYLSLNLESFFTLNYPIFELLFCINDDKDPSLEVVKRFIDKYPSVPAKIFVGGMKVGTNPKINNMQPGYEAAAYDLILISDSAIRMKQDTLLDMVSFMTPDVGLVHQMPYTCDRKGFPAILEKVYFGTAFARVYLSADFLGINCHTGMSALMRKGALDAEGGIKAFGQYLAEDYFFAKRLAQRGWRIRVCSQPALQSSATPDIESFHNRISRWAKLRFAMVPHTILLEPLSECLILGIIASWALNFLFSLDPFAVYLFHILTWFLLDFLLLSIIQNGPLPFNKSQFVVAWVFRETTALLVFFKALLDPDIKWRTGTYRLKWGGIAEEIKDKL